MQCGSSSRWERIVLGKADGRLADSLGGQKLTKREAEVYRLVSQGLPNKAVAGKLGVREGTVKFHLHIIYRKLRVSNRTGLILSAIADR